MSLGPYPDFQFFPRVGIFEGFFWPPCSFVIYFPYFMHAFSCLLSLCYFMITQPLGSNVSLGSYPSCLANYIVNIFSPNKLWSMVVRTHADRIQFAPCILLCLVLFCRSMPSIVQNENIVDSSLSLRGQKVFSIPQVCFLPFLHQQAGP